MSTNRTVVFLLMVAFVDGLLDFSEVPPAMPGLQVHRTYGQWFAIFRKPPCSWAGSTGFKNSNIVFKSRRNNVVDYRISWGDEYCNTVSGQKFALSPGVSLQKDNFGNLISGKSVTVGTDYTGCLIHWGCTKFSVFGDKCEDHYIVVLTRTPNPDARTIHMINKRLMRLWGITVDHFHRVVHTGACYGGTKVPLYKH